MDPRTYPRGGTALVNTVRGAVAQVVHPVGSTSAPSAYLIGRRGMFNNAPDMGPVLYRTNDAGRPGRVDYLQMLTPTEVADLEHQARAAHQREVAEAVRDAGDLDPEQVLVLAAGRHGNTATREQLRQVVAERLGHASRAHEGNAALRGELDRRVDSLADAWEGRGWASVQRRPYRGQAPRLTVSWTSQGREVLASARGRTAL